jgi:hypothetical protein
MRRSRSCSSCSANACRMRLRTLSAPRRPRSDAAMPTRPASRSPGARSRPTASSANWQSRAERRSPRPAQTYATAGLHGRSLLERADRVWPWRLAVWTAWPIACVLGESFGLVSAHTSMTGQRLAPITHPVELRTGSWRNLWRVFAESMIRGILCPELCPLCVSHGTNP